MNHSSHSFIKLLIHLFIHYSKLNQKKNEKISPQVLNSFLEKRSISSFDGVFDAACLSVWRCVWVRVGACEWGCVCVCVIECVSDRVCVWDVSVSELDGINKVPKWFRNIYPSYLVSFKLSKTLSYLATSERKAPPSGKIFQKRWLQVEEQASF